MNRENAKDYLPLVQALADGKVIQLTRTNGGWYDVEDINPDIHPIHYRIKPEPREIWRNRFPNGVEFGAFDSIEEARQSHLGKAKQVRYREVLE